MKFILIRHCETDWNVEHRIQGHTDTLLNENGRKQARILAEKLKSAYPKIDLIVSSDLKRARETAEIISFITNAPLILDSRLRECKHGIFDGMLSADVPKYYPAALDLISTDFQSLKPYDFGPYGGEHQNDVFGRHLDLMQEFSIRYPNKLILLVGHGRGLNTLLGSLGHPTGLAREEFREIDY